jgi:hypothetical protein
MHGLAILAAPVFRWFAFRCPAAPRIHKITSRPVLTAVARPAGGPPRIRAQCSPAALSAGGGGGGTWRCGAGQCSAGALPHGREGRGQAGPGWARGRRNSRAAGGAPGRTSRACCRPSRRFCSPPARSPAPEPCGRARELSHGRGGKTGESGHPSLSEFIGPPRSANVTDKMRGRSPDVPADPPPDACERVEAHEAGEAGGGCLLVPRGRGCVGDGEDHGQREECTSSHEAPHLYDGLMARSVKELVSWFSRKTYPPAKLRAHARCRRISPVSAAEFGPRSFYSGHHQVRQ